MATPIGAVSPAVSSKGSALTIALCFGVMVIEGYDIQALGVAAPALGRELQLAPALLGQALSAANISLVFGAIIGGWLADLVGRKPVLIGATLTFGVFTLLTMESTSYTMLFYARLLTGLGFGGALPNIMAIAADMATAKRRGSTAAMMFCGLPAGGSVVALLSWLQTNTDLNISTDWRLLFMVGGLIPLVLAPLLYFFMKETRQPVKQATGANGSLKPWLSVIPLGLLFWLLIENLSAMPSFRSLAAVAPWLGGLLGILGGYLIAHRAVLFGSGRAWASIFLWLTFFPTLLILYLVLNWLPTLVAAKGFPADASLSSLCFNSFAVVGALVVGYLIDRFGPRWPLFLTFVAVMGVLIALAQATALTSVLLLSGMLGFFLLGANYALYGAGASYYPAEMRGRGSGAAVAWGRLGSVVGPLAGGLLLQGGAPPSEVVNWMVPVAAVAAVGTLLLTFLTKPEN